MVSSVGTVIKLTDMLTEIRWTVIRTKTARSHMMEIEPTVTGH